VSIAGPAFALGVALGNEGALGVAITRESDAASGRLVGGLELGVGKPTEPDVDS
jgi:hypothetical protein